MKISSLAYLTILALLAIVQAGCGGGGGGGGGAAATFSLSAAPSSLPADGTTTSTVTATFSSAVPDGTVVHFAVISGPATMSAASATTTANKASITVSSITAGVAIITATSGGVAANANAAVAFNSPGVTVTALENGAPNNVALANNADIVTIQATFPASVTTGTSVTYTATPVAIGGSNGANALFINNTNTIAVSTVGSVASTTVASGTIGGAIITASAGTLQGSVYVKFITQPTAVNVSVAVVPGGAVTTIPALGDLGYNLINTAGCIYVSNSAAALNSASGSFIAANQNTATSTTIGLINATGFTPTALPIEQLTFSITSPGLPAFAVSNTAGTITAADANGTAISPSLTAANFAVTLKFNTDTF